MDKKSFQTDLCIFDEIHHLVQRLLDEGGAPDEISYQLAATAMGLGIKFAPDPLLAVAVVMDGIRNVSALHSKSAKQQETPEDQTVSVPMLATVH